MRFRITLRNDAPRVELRGYADFESYQSLVEFSKWMKPYALVIASPQEDDFDPFTGGEDG